MIAIMKQPGISPGFFVARHNHGRGMMNSALRRTAGVDDPSLRVSALRNFTGADFARPETPRALRKNFCAARSTAICACKFCTP
jgi:hypothetical protein